jgi:hypothetical protein
MARGTEIGQALGIVVTTILQPRQKAQELDDFSRVFAVGHYSAAPWSAP